MDLLNLFACFRTQASTLMIQYKRCSSLKVMLSLQFNVHSVRNLRTLFLLKQDCDLSGARSLVSFLPPMVRSQMGVKLGDKKRLCDSGMNFNSYILSVETKL